MSASVLSKLRRGISWASGAKPIFIVSVCAWVYDFYHLVFVEHKRSVGMWPIEVAIPVMFGLLFIGYYYWVNPTDGQDPVAARIISYVFLVAGLVGAWLH